MRHYILIFILFWPILLNVANDPSSPSPISKDCTERLKMAKLYQICFYVVVGVGGLLTFLFLLAFILVRVAACVMRSQGMDAPKKPWETVVDEEPGNQGNATRTENASGYGTVGTIQDQ